jgi:hypothetical protein
MKIYEHEVKAGLLESIEKDTSVAFTCDINLEPKFQYDVEKALAKLSGNPNQSDLFYIESVLVSTNWNGNDDVFSKDEVWPARSTAIDKQFNYMHNEKDIIGHMTSAHIVDVDGNEVDMSLSLAQAPDFFDIVVGSVIYKKWSDPELQSRMNQIIADIQAGKKFVSMEARFKDFDYAAIAEDNSMLVIARNEKTSFITKHLRAYGGNGSYEGYRVGRLLKDVTFSGKGLVDNPANKRSHIKSYSFNGTKASLQEDFRSQAMENTVSKAELDATKAILDNAKAELEKVKADLDKVKAEKQTVEAELVNEKALSGQKSEKIQALEISVAKYGEDMKKKDEDEKKMKAELLKRDRVAALLGAGVESAKASEVAEKFAQASDEMFKEVVALHSVAKKDDKEKTEAEKEAEAEKMEEEKAKKAKAELEKSKEEESKATVVLPTGETDDALFTSASQWMSQTLGIKE